MNQGDNGTKEQARKKWQRTDVPGLYLVGDKYFARCMVHGRRIFQFVGYRKIQAREAMKKLQSELVDRKFGLVDSQGGHTLQEAITFHLDYLRENEADIENVDKHLRVLKSSVGGERKLHTVTTEDVRKAWKGLPSKSKKATKNRYLGSWRRLFNLAIKEEWITENPANRVEMIRMTEEERIRTRVLLEKEEVKLMEACDDPTLKSRSRYLKGLIIVALNTGMRLSECFNMRWDAVNLENDIIKLPKTKSGKVQSVPMNATVANMLARLRGKNGEEWVFPSVKMKGRPPTQIRKAFGKACELAGIKGLRFHDLRHTFGTRLLQRGVDIITVKELMRHSSVKMTERYVHTLPEHKHLAVKKLAEGVNRLSTRESELTPRT